MVEMKSRWWLVFILLGLLWGLWGCGDDACHDDGDCPQGQRCSQSAGLFFGANTCITDNFGEHSEVSPDAGAFDSDGEDQANSLSADATTNNTNSTDPPKVEITDHPNSITNEREANFYFDCHPSDCAYFCELDDDGGQPCDSPMNYDGLDDGVHHFQVWAEDTAGQVGDGDGWSWEIDTVAPRIIFEQTPEETTLAMTATFDVSCDKSPCQLECKLIDVDSDYGQCSVSYDELDAGEYLFRARGTDPAGNTVTEEFEWTVEAVRWKQVNLGNHHSCAIMANDDSLWCWGPHADGRTGVGLTDGHTAEPMQIEGEWSSVVAGARHTCGIKLDGALYCWGENKRGQLGLGHQTSVSTPHQVGSQNDWQNISLQTRHTCGVRAGGRGYCWGRGEHGQIGDGEYNSHDSPVEIRGYFNDFEDWHEIGAGEAHTCGRRGSSASLWCWGHNFDRFPEYKSADDHQSLSVGWHHSCAIGPGATRRLYCWGENDRGQVGLTDGGFYSEPVGISSDWAQVNAGVFHTCGVRSDASLDCWGDNELGQLGVGDTEQRSSPTPVVNDDGQQWESVAGGHAHSCAIDQNRKLYCWGNADSGKLANGSLSGVYTTPQPVNLDFL